MKTWLKIAVFMLAALPAVAEDKPLIDFGAGGVEARLKADNNVDFKVVDKALNVTINPGPADYPGLHIAPEGKAWDLSAFGHVTARVINTGDKSLALNLRVDNAGDWHDNPWNTETIHLKGGETGTVTVIFGYGYGYKPGYALKPAEIVNILLFTGKAVKDETFRIESLVAGGAAGEKPPLGPLDPKTVRLKPKTGVILGENAAFNVTVGNNNVPWAIAREGAPLPAIGVQNDTNKTERILKPSIGRWDLRDYTQVRVKLKNTGQTPVTPGVQLASGSGNTTDRISATIAADAEAEIIVPFAPAIPGKCVPVTKPGFFGLQRGTGTAFVSDAVDSIRISDPTLLVESIVAEAPIANGPDWLGKRPPVEGDWVKTFDDEFDGTAIDTNKWNIYGPNYWDKKSHWTKDNLIVRDGKVTLRFEKKHGYHNDNPDEKKPKNLTGSNESDYACGYLDSFNKFAQRYGYFEARVKLPAVPGLWPTFWMMPDRGGTNNVWKRTSTSNDGMEFDILEHLTRWGPHRYNTAMHWDGYEKQHKSVGSSNNYVETDKDGYITCGMLWQPGLAVYYGNGKELMRWEDPRIGSTPGYFIIEMTTGGWDNNAVDDKQLPADYSLDYVRVWQRKDLAEEKP